MTQQEDSLAYSLVGVAIYILVGAIIGWFYYRAARKTYYQSYGSLPDVAAVNVALGIMLILWPVIAPFEWGTHFKSWKRQ